MHQIARKLVELRIPALRPLVLMCLALFAATGQGRAVTEAPKITVSPANYSLSSGHTVQYTATVTGLSGTGVTWSAGGVVGGNATAGTISATGLYTSPATIPAQNPVSIKATSTVDTSVSGSVYVTILTKGPKLTSVTPNPLNTGTITVTVTGTGFLANAQVFAKSNGANVALSTVSETSTQIVATGYQAAATSTDFTAKNPGSSISNVITVPVSGDSTGGTTGGTTGGSTGGTTGGTTKYTLTVVNGSGSGSYASGTTVNIVANTAGTGQQFLNWTGATVANANAASTSLSMPAATTTVTANYTSVAVNIPYPVTTHPRLWITQADLPRLQSWAVSSNPIYAQGVAPLIQQAVTAYQTNFFPGGVAANPFPDPGDTQGYGILGNTNQSSDVEDNAVVLALGSLIDPSATNRIRDAQYARNLIMYAMNLAKLGPLSGAPFRDPLLPVYNRANASGQDWPLAIDWIYNAKDASNNPILTAADKLTIRNVFLIWANECLNASTTGGDHPVPIGVTNNAQLLPGNKPYRMASNNYYLGHARLLTMMALCIDPADDPAVNSAAPLSQTGNSMRSYILNANGAWLYQEFAMMGDPATVGAAYNMGNGAGFGLASGGLPPEGMLYGHSFAYVLGQLLALQTAGFNNQSYSGPQIGLIGAPVWDRFAKGYIASMTPVPIVDPSQSYLGPVYEYGSYGDLLRLWVTPDMMQSYALLDMLDKANGSTVHDSMARWFVVNAVEGGANALNAHVSNPWSYGSIDGILYFLMMDPATPAAPDPRPSLPSTFWDPGAARLISHTSWTATGTMFDYRASWISINHQNGDGGQFELYRNGEWLTKEMSNYDNNAVGLTTVYHNTLALQNWSANGTPNLAWFEGGEWANGSQWNLAENAGDPTTVMSQGTGYTYLSSDLTKLYNKPDIYTPAAGATDITQATRSLVWLLNDFVIVYDRATSTHSGLFKRFNLSLVTNPTISGHTATETMASGQKLYIQTLLPTSPSITTINGAVNLNPIAALEPTKYVMTVQDPSLPTDTRFLHVLQGANSGVAMTAATRVQSTAGAAFDGVSIGSYLIYFPVNSGTVAGTTLTAPAVSHTAIVTGLAASTAYTVTVSVNGTGHSIAIAPGAGSTSDAAGVLRVTF